MNWRALQPLICTICGHRKPLIHTRLFSVWGLNQDAWVALCPRCHRIVGGYDVQHHGKTGTHGKREAA